jgi:hypothetical protein
MAGNRPMIVQPRDLHLLRELSVMRVIDREQAKVVAGFTSTTRANTRLLTLTTAGLLRRFFLGSGGGRKALYALSLKGAQLAQVPMRGPRRPQGALLIADNFVQHQLTVNGIYCTAKYGTIPVPQVTFHRWLGFYEPMVPAISLIPDGYVEFQTGSGMIACFLEVDLGHESLTIWKEKGSELSAACSFRGVPKAVPSGTLSGSRCREFGTPSALDSRSGRGGYRKALLVRNACIGRHWFLRPSLVSA